MHNFSSYFGSKSLKNMVRHEEREDLVRDLGELAGKRVAKPLWLHARCLSLREMTTECAQRGT